MKFRWTPEATRELVLTPLPYIAVHRIQENVVQIPQARCARPLERLLKHVFFA